MKNLTEVSGTPQISSAFGGWGRNITLIKVVQKIVNALVQETKFTYSFQGVVQPFSAKEIMLKPEGERAWNWSMIHWFNSPQNLNVNDKIIYKGLYYKVMRVWSYTEYNYIQYDIIEDFQPTSI